VGNNLRIYTDGSCLGNPGPGGWAWAIDEYDFCWNSDPATTNNRMELMAVLKALVRNVGTDLTIVSDSAYVVSCFRDEWWADWTVDGFKRKTHEAVANWDLWEPVLAISLFGEDEVTYEKVRAHSDDYMNDFVDDLARKASNYARRGI